MDWLRRGLIGIILIGVLLVLISTGVHWGWWIGWLTIGFFVVLNVVGFASVPLYRRLGEPSVDAAMAAIEKRIEEEKKIS